MSEQKITPYLEIRNKLSTFTIINCEHKNILLRLIGHTAVVYICQETGQLMVLESNVGAGVHLTPMGKWLSERKGKVFVRIPEFIHDPEIYSAEVFMVDRLNKAEEFIKNNIGSSYPNLKTWSGRMKLILSALDLEILGGDIFQYTGDDDGIFCTMLVIMLLQHCGLMSMKTIASECEPDDTRTDFTMAHCLINCTYGKEIRIK